MIHVKRSPCPPPLNSKDPKSAASIEMSKARVFYARVRNKPKNFAFSVYKRKDVTSELERLFHKKCAYCESKYAAVSPVDIEHYRPKGGVIVNGKLRWPGYWWLAADWQNLLPSCIDCNRKRRHVFPDEKQNNARGKENLFPIYDEKDRGGRDENSERNERPLLLDPCRDDPESYLDFLHEAGRVGPRKGLAGERRERAKASIQACGLDRPELCEVRRDYQSRVMQQAEIVMTAFAKLRARPSAHARRRALANELRDLKSLAADDAEYASVARALARPLYKEVRTWLNEQFANDLKAVRAKDSILWLLDNYPATAINDSRVGDFISRVNEIRAS